MNESISMFIDDELNIDEKMDFVNKIHVEDRFYSETVDLLEQEKLLRSDAVSVVPQVSLKEKSKLFSFKFLMPYLRVAEFGVAAVIVLFFVFSFLPGERSENEGAYIPKRFVIYEPDAQNVQIVGSFTDWNNVPMRMTGPEGYWEIELNIRKGEHKYLFIVGDNKKIADPTILTRERDDFGSENTVLLVET